MERRLGEVVASQSALIQKLGRQAPALPPQAMERALEAHLKQVKASLQLRAEMRLWRVDYHDVLENPHRVGETIQQFLGVALNFSAMAAQVDSSLHRQRQPGTTLPVQGSSAVQC